LSQLLIEGVTQSGLNVNTKSTNISLDYYTIQIIYM